MTSAAMCPSPRYSRSSVCGVPEHEVVLVGPGERGVAGEERTALDVLARGLRGAARPATRLRRAPAVPIASGSDRRSAPSAARSRASMISRRGGALPRGGDRRPDELGPEVVEGRDHDLGVHGAHRRGAGAEVAHAADETERARTRSRPRARSRSSRGAVPRCATCGGRSSDPSWSRRLRFGAVEVGAAAGRQFVADAEADRQAEVLELADVELERLRLPAHRRREVGRPLGRAGRGRVRGSPVSTRRDCWPGRGGRAGR